MQFIWWSTITVKPIISDTLKFRHNKRAALLAVLLDNNIK